MAAETNNTCISEAITQSTVKKYSKKIFLWAKEFFEDENSAWQSAVDSERQNENQTRTGNARTSVDRLHKIGQKYINVRSWNEDQTKAK